MRCLPRSEEYREEQYLRMLTKIRSLIDDSIEHPEYSGGVHQIDNLEHFIMSHEFYSLATSYRDMAREVEYYKEQNERLIKQLKGEIK